MKLVLFALCGMVLLSGCVVHEYPGGPYRDGHYNVYYYDDDSRYGHGYYNHRCPPGHRKKGWC